MSNYTYTRRGSNTTIKIEDASLTEQKIWERANNLGINILRVRVRKERNEVTQGNTFDGIHTGKVSAYIQRKNPIDALWFRKYIKLGESNKGMQVLEVARNLDAEEVLRTLDQIEVKLHGGLFTRLVNTFKAVVA